MSIGRKNHSQDLLTIVLHLYPVPKPDRQKGGTGSRMGSSWDVFKILLVILRLNKLIRNIINFGKSAAWQPKFMTIFSEPRGYVMTSNA